MPRLPWTGLSLRHRLAVSFAAAFALTLLILFVTLHFALRNVLLADLDSDLDTSAGVLAGEIVVDGSLVSQGELARAVHSPSLELLARPPSVVAVLYPDGAVAARAGSASLEHLTPNERDLARLQAGSARYQSVTAGGRSLRRHLTPVFGDSGLLAIVLTAASQDPVTSATSRLQTLLVVEGIAAGVVAIAIGYLVAGRGLLPIAHVADLAADIEAHDLTGRLQMQRAPVEIRRLADTFDAMLDRLERAFALQRNFALDVAHELRTPLTALRGNLDVLLLDPGLEPEVRGQIERLTAETGRLTRLTSNLLSLAQAEAGRKPERRPVDLDVVCLEVFQQARTLRPGVRLQLGHEDQVTVTGDRDLLMQLVLNLVENGLKYTPTGGSVTLSIDRDGDRARVVVADTGPGIAPEHLPHIFERFYRAPAGDQKRVAGGAGIGLAVAQWIAREHGGEIRVDSTPGAGTTFTVCLPIAGPTTT